MKLSMPKALIATESEYRANLTGLNTFFGAVLGFVMAGTERLDATEFAYVLFIVSGAVISILYVHASSQKIAYSVSPSCLSSHFHTSSPTCSTKASHFLTNCSRRCWSGRCYPWSSNIFRGDQTIRR